MAFMDVKAVYRSVIDEVTTRSRPEFVQEGVDEAVLDELRELWEEKLRASGVLAAEPERARYEPYQQALGPQGYYSTIQSAHQMQNLGRPATYFSNVPWQQRPMLGVPGPAAQTVQTGAGSLQQAQPSASRQVQPSGNNPLPMFYPGSQAYLQQQVAAGVSTNGYQLPTTQQIRPQYVQSGLQGGQSHPQAAANGAAAQASQQRSYVSHAGAQGVSNPQLQAQNQGANGWQQAGTGSQGPALDEASRKRKAEELQAAFQRAKQQMLSQQQPGQGGNPGALRGPLPQQDGPSEAGGDDKDEDDSDEEEEPEKEELENFSDIASSNEDEEEENLPNQCISQFIKVQRTKNKWKCQLRSGILHLNGRDHVFGSATGEFQF